VPAGEDQGGQEDREKGRGPLWGGLFRLSGALDGPVSYRQPILGERRDAAPVGSSTPSLSCDSISSGGIPSWLVWPLTWTLTLGVAGL
jgi:hypothetical protein